MGTMDCPWARWIRLDERKSMNLITGVLIQPKVLPSLDRPKTCGENIFQKIITFNCHCRSLSICPNQLYFQLHSRRDLKQKDNFHITSKYHSTGKCRKKLTDAMSKWTQSRKTIFFSK
ncbi:GfV-B50-ORF1 [Ichnoviriform fumiferanae]|uniref:GfV-B50-ORF1 n=1 Tax=Ichnoviriform fumiferanae TaxID=419435 RepID=A2PZU7_9VIRU|nr:GfV-B50-ORF1 [Ichnoviriform fumiferanae]BAF45519.1 GfV-B50-ORF1 [Ichnoviriform fumiferanae]